MEHAKIINEVLINPNNIQAYRKLINLYNNENKLIAQAFTILLEKKISKFKNGSYNSSSSGQPPSDNK